MIRALPSPPVVTRIWGVSTAAVGAVALVAPQQVATLVGGRGTAPDARLVRILGARQLAQGAAVLIHPAPALVAAGCGIDVVHGASMVLAARIWPAHRTAALISATAAGTVAVTGVLILLGRWR